MTISATPPMQLAIQYWTKLNAIGYGANCSYIHIYAEFSESDDQPPPPRLIVIGIDTRQHIRCQRLASAEVPRVAHIEGRIRWPGTPFVCAVDRTVSDSLLACPATVSAQF